MSGFGCCYAIPEIIQEKTLAMKLRVHDDIGHSILAARKLCCSHTDQELRCKRGAVGTVNFSALSLQLNMTQSEPLETAKKQRKVGVSVLLTGNEPQRQWIRALIALAICECAANCPSADGTNCMCVLAEAGLHGVALTNNVQCRRKDHRGQEAFPCYQREEAGGKVEFGAALALS